MFTGLGRGNRHFGHIHKDDRASGGQLIEQDCLTCNHCQRILVFRRDRLDVPFCGMCAAHICQECKSNMVKGTASCVPFEKLVEEHLDRQHRQQQLLK